MPRPQILLQNPDSSSPTQSIANTPSRFEAHASRPADLLQLMMSVGSGAMNKPADNPCGNMIQCSSPCRLGHALQPKLPHFPFFSIARLIDNSADAAGGNLPGAVPSLSARLRRELRTTRHHIAGSQSKIRSSAPQPAASAAAPDRRA